MGGQPPAGGGQPVAEPVGSNCVACNQPLQPGQTHCPQCGTEQPASTGSVPTEPVTPEPAPSAPTTEPAQPVGSGSTPAEDSSNQGGGGTSGGMGGPTV